MVDIHPVVADYRRDYPVRVYVPARNRGTEPVWPRLGVLGSIPGPARRRAKAAGMVARRLGYEALATPRLSRSTLRLNAMTRPSTPSRRRTELNSERCTAS